MAGNHEHTGASCPCRYTGKVAVGGDGERFSLRKMTGGEEAMKPAVYGGAERKTDLRPERLKAGSRDSNKGKK